MANEFWSESKCIKRTFATTVMADPAMPWIQILRLLGVDLQFQGPFYREEEILQRGLLPGDGLFVFVRLEESLRLSSKNAIVKRSIFLKARDTPPRILRVSLR